MTKKFKLKPHPDTPHAAVSGVVVEVARSKSGVLTLRYKVAGKIDQIKLPPRSQSARADRLWKHTCFEVFIRGEGEGYLEYNFSPSTQWAAYAFASYRSDMRPAEVSAPAIAVTTDAKGVALAVTISLPAELSKAPWRLGLSAVIEETSGAKSYWALAHASGKPDFHQSDCFAAKISATGGA